MYIVTFAFFQGFTRTARNTRNSGIGGTNCEPISSLFFLKIPLWAFLISSLLACYQPICRLASFHKKTGEKLWDCTCARKRERCRNKLNNSLTRGTGIFMGLFPWEDQNEKLTLTLLHVKEIGQENGGTKYLIWRNRFALVHEKIKVINSVSSCLSLSVQ